LPPIWNIFRPAATEKLRPPATIPRAPVISGRIVSAGGGLTACRLAQGD
jgi:hypothetical protein